MFLRSPLAFVGADGRVSAVQLAVNSLHGHELDVSPTLCSSSNLLYCSNESAELTDCRKNKLYNAQPVSQL